MSTTRTLVVLTALILLGGAPELFAQRAEIDKPAPGFTLPDTHGKEHTLSDQQGKWVVLEWLNYDCPFVKKHYNSGNMPSLQKSFTDKGVVWFAIVSSAPGKQGYFAPDVMNQRSEQAKSVATAVLMDPEGTVGRLYNARTTPQMVLIDPEGNVLYNGAIDDKPTTRLEDVDGAHNYLIAAADEAMAGQPVSVPTTQPYGCSVKYK
ncbi:MAG: thioredoxin family protein [Gemmatimonadales bacterium]|jgi:peroxiredoxin